MANCDENSTAERRQKMKTYSQYKDSGVKWIGEIPSHWKSCRFKNFVSLVNTPSTDENKVGLENIESGTGRFISTDSEFEGDGIQFVENDIVYGKLRPYLRKVWLATNKGNAVGDFFVFRAKSSDSSYIKWLMLSDGFTSMANGSTFGAKMPRVASDFILSMHYILPPLPEQQAIASFLDKKIGAIDGIISKRERQIELLEEMKSSIISHAVTKGLNPNAKMKDSGIEWIGEIPEEWIICKIKDIVFMQSGDTLSAVDFVEDGTYPVYGGNGFRGYYSDYNVEGLHVLVGRQGALCGNINYADGRFWATEHAVVCYPKQKLAIKWLGEILRTMNLNRYSVSAAQPGLAVDKIKNVKMPLPPLPEQEQIASYLDAETAKIDTRIAKRRRQIELLQEYKQALITAAVTGKIDVREKN